MAIFATVPLIVAREILEREEYRRRKRRRQRWSPGNAGPAPEGHETH